MPSLTKTLVKSPAAVQFIEMAHIDSGLDAMLGQPEIDPHVGVDIQSARIALRDAAKKVVALVDDPTRTEVDKHVAAQKLATAVEKKLTSAKAEIERRAEHLRSDALRQADIALGPSRERASLHSEVRAWVREVAKTSEGLTKIKQELKDSEDLASVLWHSPGFLLDFPTRLISIFVWRCSKHGDRSCTGN
jgi:hypothetical protein